MEANFLFSRHAQLNDEITGSIASGNHVAEPDVLIVPRAAHLVNADADVLAAILRQQSGKIPLMQTPCILHPGPDIAT